MHRRHVTIREISDCAAGLFGGLYSEKQFRAQLCWFDDVDATEQVDYMMPHPPADDAVKQALTAFAVQGL